MLKRLKADLYILNMLYIVLFIPYAMYIYGMNFTFILQQIGMHKWIHF